MFIKKKVTKEIQWGEIDKLREEKNNKGMKRKDDRKGKRKGEMERYTLDLSIEVQVSIWLFVHQSKSHYFFFLLLSNLSLSLSSPSFPSSRYLPPSINDFISTRNCSSIYPYLSLSQSVSLTSHAPTAPTVYHSWQSSYWILCLSVWLNTSLCLPFHHFP